ncbi:33 kDa ribonucleoprotein, chloroplastic-like [Carica papaya]|uniref:33 kDa ribonucleoprotein, chloroplastic-like n=1 Tax=Carica papaya TaxID=3649 RepID=UPI000B8C7635|nr:33 kDa ribonucleoprotein, chloroplastic-like [Carica papaya]
MAATATTASSSLCNKLCNLPFTPSPIPLRIHFQSSKPKYPKPLRLKTQNPHSFPFSILSSLSNSRCFSATFDSFQITEDDSQKESEAEEEQEEEEEVEEEEEAEEDEEGENAKRSGDDVGRLYVGNLPYAMTSSQVAEYFGEAGDVVSVEIVYDRVTDRSRGFAFVTMGSNEEAKEAIRMFDGSQMGGRTVRVNFPEVPRGGEREVMGPKIRSGYKGFVDSPYKIYAGNLGWGLTSQGLRDAFADQPGLMSAKVIYDRNSGRSRGFGFVSFESEEDLQAALNAMNGVEVEGRPLKLNVAAERAPLTPPPASQRDRESNIDSSELLSASI